MKQVLQQFWDKKLKNMPRKEVQAHLKEAGFNFPTGSLTDEELRKVYLGLLSKLDEESLKEALSQY